MSVLASLILADQEEQIPIILMMLIGILVGSALVMYVAGSWIGVLFKDEEAQKDLAAIFGVLGVIGGVVAFCYAYSAYML